MGNDSSKAQGTDFKANRRQKRVAAADDGEEEESDIPVIPYVKHKKISAEVQQVVNRSIWLCNFKRAFRGYLRRKPERSQTGTQLRIHEQSLNCADDLGLPKDSFQELVQQLVDEVGLLWYEEALEFLQDRGKVKPGDDVNTERNVVNRAMERVFRQMAEDYVVTVGKKLYEKYSRGADFEVSDLDVDEERKRRLAEQRQEALRRAAEEREREALEWKKEAEMEAQIHEARMRDVERLRQEQKKIQQHGLL